MQVCKGGFHPQDQVPSGGFFSLNATVRVQGSNLLARKEIGAELLTRNRRGAPYRALSPSLA